MPIDTEGVNVNKYIRITAILLVLVIFGIVITPFNKKYDRGTMFFTLFMIGLALAFAGAIGNIGIDSKNTEEPVICEEYMLEELEPNKYALYSKDGFFIKYTVVDESGITYEDGKKLSLDDTEVFNLIDTEYTKPMYLTCKHKYNPSKYSFFFSFALPERNVLILSSDSIEIKENTLQWFQKWDKKSS